jgi:hypothetical protein
LRTRPAGYSSSTLYLNSRESRTTVISIVIAMLVILILAAVVVLYVAFPHRGEDVPHTPWVGDAMRKGVDLLPTLHNQRAREREPSDV